MSLLELGLGPLAFGDVAYGGGDEHAPVGLQRAQGDLDGELDAVVAQPVELEAHAHGADLRVGEEGIVMPRWRSRTRSGRSTSTLLADELVALVAEELLGLAVDQGDAAPGVDDDHGVGGGLEQAAKHGLGPLAFGDVADGGGDEHAPVGLQRAQGDLDGELDAVVAQPVELEAHAHGADLRVGEEGIAMPEVAVPDPLGQEHLHVAPDQLVAARSRRAARSGG